MSSLDTTMDEGYSFVSNTDAIIYPTSDYSGCGGDSMISDPNIVSSSTSTNDHHHQQISTAGSGGGGGGDDLMIVSSSSGASSRFMNNINDKQSEIRIFNVDFRALSGGAVLSTPSYFTTSPILLPQKHFQRNYQLEPQEGSPFRKFGSTLAPNASVVKKGSPVHKVFRVHAGSGEGPHPNAPVAAVRNRRQSMLKRSIIFFRNLYLMRPRATSARSHDLRERRR